MPQYTFNTVEAGDVREGSKVELPKLQAVKEMATEYVGDLIKERDGSIFDRDIVIEVSDGDGLMLLRIAVVGLISPAARLAA